MTWPGKHRVGCVASLLITLLLAAQVRAKPPPARDPAESRVIIDNALGYLRGEQEDDGGFGSDQPHLSTAVATLAFLSSSARLSPEDEQCVSRAAAYLVRTASPNGDLGDNIFRTESHALATAALLAAGARLKGDAAAQALAAAEAAVSHLQRAQDRGGAAGTRGGWKMEAGDTRENDRRATAWALWAITSARLYGFDTRQSDLDRALRFLTASLKERAEREDEVGGLSVDTEGLVVASASAMGGWALAKYRFTTPQARLNLAWLTRHPPQWAGPTYFHTNFFHLRALRLSDSSGAVFADHHRRVLLQVREHQLGDGSVAFPPGEAQNLVAMGRVFSTAMSVLILNTGDNRLVADEDFRTPVGF